MFMSRRILFELAFLQGGSYAGESALSRDMTKREI